MPWGLKRFQQTGNLHFLTFSCYKRRPNLGTPKSRSTFETALERVRKQYELCVYGYVVMPEHVHLLVSEPERGPLAKAMQSLKQGVARRLALRATDSFWLERYYDFNVWNHSKFVEKLCYIHRNPVERGLVERPEDWAWSSFRHYLNGDPGTVEIESHWTVRKRERSGISPTVRVRPPENPAQAKLERGTQRYVSSFPKICPLAWYSSSPVARRSYFRRIRMRRLLLVVGAVCLCASLALAQGKTSNAWTCPKPADAHSIEIGDKPGHAYSIDQITCTSTKGEIAGVREKEGTGTEFAEVTGNSMKGHGVFVETMANGDKIHFVYQFTATTKDGQMQSGSNKYQATSGAGKFKGIKSSGTCTGTAAADGSVNWSCTGTYSVP